MAVAHDIELIAGKTFTDILRWETAPIVRIPIVGITCPNGAALINASGHGLPNGWRVAVTNVKGMTEINAEDPQRIRDSEYHQATVVSADLIELNEVNAAGFKPWTSGGFVQYNTPVSLTGISARMAIKAVAGEYLLLRCSVAGTSGTTKPTGAGKDGATLTWVATTLPATKEWLPGTAYAVDDVIDAKALLFLTVGNGRIVIDTVAKTIKRTIAAADVAAATWKTGYYDLEAFSSDTVSVVTLLDFGKVTIGKENTK